MTWRVETLSDTVDKELDSLPADMRARFTQKTRRTPRREIELALRRAKEALQ